MLELKNIYAGYSKGNDILKGIDLTLNENEVVAVVGQNGSSKSTLAKSIMGMVPYIYGEINYNGELLIKKTIPQIANLGIGFFIQGGRIFPHLTVEENLEFACSGLRKKDTAERREEIKQYFDLLKGDSRSKLKASYLSGGEKHQLALAMVLIRKPNLLILDEPSAGLSPGYINTLYNILFQIKQSKVCSILVIEQNLELSLKLSNRYILLQNGQIINEQLTKELEENPKIENILFN